MPRSTDLKAILERILAGKGTTKERQAVQRALVSGQVVLTASGRSVASEKNEKAVIVIGSYNQVRVETSEVA